MVPAILLCFNFSICDINKIIGSYQISYPKRMIFYLKKNYFVTNFSVRQFKQSSIIKSKIIILFEYSWKIVCNTMLSMIFQYG